MALDISWREVARQAGVSAPIFTRLRQGKQPDVNTYGAIVRWLGIPAEKFLIKSDGTQSRLRSAPKDKPMSPRASAAMAELIQLIYRLAKILHEGEQEGGRPRQRQRTRKTGT